MKPPETLFFPDTTFTSPRQLPLALLFQKIGIVLPTQEDSPDEKKPLDIFMSSAYCQKLFPHPLNEDRSRFLNLINDIKKRKDDYAEQLSHLSLASLSAPQTEDTETRHQLLSTLLGKTPTTSEMSENAGKNALWQTRLVLKIAEILDREQEEIAQALVFLEKSENDIFDQLRGEDDRKTTKLYEDMVKVSTEMSKPSRQSINKRMRSWFQFITGSTLPTYPVWSTTRQEVADILFENHAIKHGHTPRHLTSLELPAHLGTTITTVLEKLAEFHQAHDDALSSPFANLFADSSSTYDERSAFQSHWQALLEQFYPTTTFGRKSAHFYNLASPIPQYSGVDLARDLNGPTILCLCPF